jgi:phage shock protein A
LIDRFENPVENLDYSFEKHKQMINSLRREIAEVVSAKRHLQIQKDNLSETVQVLDHQAHQAIEYGKDDDLARSVLKKKSNTVADSEIR